MSTVGRPKMNGLDKVIKVTVNEEVADMLDNTVKETGKSKSEILRELIPIVSSKDFEGMIPSTNMEILQSYSDKCWDILHTPGCIFEVEDLSKRLPAFLATWGEQVVYVKYPTFKIQIFNGVNNKKSTDQNTLEKLLQNVENRSKVYATKADYLIVGGRMECMDFPYVNEVMCLEIGMKNNIDCKNKIVEILNDNGYDTSVFPAYCIRGIEVELMEDGKYFKVKQQKI